MDLNALMQGAMQDPAARDFITQLLSQPNQRVQTLAQYIQPRQGPQFADMSMGEQSSPTQSFDNARSLMDELLGQPILPPEQGPPAPPPGAMGAPGGAAPPPAAPPGMSPPTPLAPLSPIETSVLGPMEIGGINLSLLDEMLGGMSGPPAATGFGPR